VKSQASQARAMLLRTRDLLVRQRTQTINALEAGTWWSSGWWRRRDRRI
jgi:transposase